MKKRIYAADDEDNIRNLIKMFLEADGYDVSLFENGDQLFAAFLAEPCDLVLLDVMMPGTDGLTVCANLRKISKVPIVILTAKDDDTDLIAGITLGSDDYLTKPFRPTLLSMRVKAILRRVELERGSAAAPPESACGDLRYCEKEQCVYARGVDLGLTANERKLLSLLMARAGEAVSRDALLQKIWGTDADVETRVTDETLRRVRRKLEAAGSTVHVSSVWGYGYKLVAGGKP
ncbi:MAG: response regulator transcription factor [Clostridia bacterium]